MVKHTIFKNFSHFSDTDCHSIKKMNILGMYISSHNMFYFKYSLMMFAKFRAGFLFNLLFCTLPQMVTMGKALPTTIKLLLKKRVIYAEILIATEFLHNTG